MTVCTSNGTIAGRRPQVAGRGMVWVWFSVSCDSSSPYRVAHPLPAQPDRLSPLVNKLVHQVVMRIQNNMHILYRDARNALRRPRLLIGMLRYRHPIYIDSSPLINSLCHRCLCPTHCRLAGRQLDAHGSCAGCTGAGAMVADGNRRSGPP